MPQEDLITSRFSELNPVPGSNLIEPGFFEKLATFNLDDPLIALKILHLQWHFSWNFGDISFDVRQSIGARHADAMVSIAHEVDITHFVHLNRWIPFH
ncbi:MAG: hypothetical protein ACK4SA_24265 [Caldilinea sp.]